MAELLGLGASAIAFISLAGQVLQGCQYVHDFIDNTRDAPNELRHYHTEILHFKSAVLGFQEVLQAIKPFAKTENSAKQALLALQSGGTAINESKAFLQKLEQSGEWDLWRSIKVARKKSELAKYVARLGGAKVNILLAQSQVNLLLGLNHSNNRDQLQQIVTSLSSSSTSPLLQSTQVQNSIIDLKKSNSQKFEELKAMQNILGERLDILGAALGPMVTVAVSNAVSEVYADLEETRKFGRWDSSPSSLADRAYPTYRQQRWPTASASHQRLSTNTRAAGQIRYERTMNLWFATITLQSRSIIAQEMLSSNQNECWAHDTISRRIRVNIRLHSWILRRGVLAFLEKQYLCGTSLSADMRLRVYSVVSCCSPIAEACRSGDFATAYGLFQSGQASVFDVVEERNESLLDHTWRYLKKCVRFRSYETAVEPRVRDGLLETFKFLASHGLDPGEPARRDDGEPQMSRIQQIFDFAIVGPDFLTSYLVEIIRIIITRSRQNPFEAQSRYQGPLMKLACEMRPDLAACIRSQDRWCLQGCFEEDHLFPIEPSSRKHYAGGPFSAFCVYSLIGDPDATYLSAILHFNITEYYLPYICLHALINSRELTENIGGCWDCAVKTRVLACLKAGMDWNDVVSLDNVSNDWVTLVEFFASKGSLHILEAAWLELGNDLGSFYANFEGEIVCAVVRDLDALRPARQWLQAEARGRIQEMYELSRGIFFDDAYRKFFPDDEEEIKEIGCGFNPVTFSCRMRGLVEDDLDTNAESCAEFNNFDVSSEATESLPAVNGLTEEFWD